jgi:hypothetical protein
MSSQSSFSQLFETHERLKLHFIVIELDLAITFCQIATTTKDKNSAARNGENAKRAYRSARRTLESANLALKTNQEIGGKIKRLKKLFADLKVA